MSKNHYSRQVLQLEALMASKMKQLKLLETEHSLLLGKASDHLCSAYAWLPADHLLLMSSAEQPHTQFCRLS